MFVRVPELMLSIVILINKHWYLVSGTSASTPVFAGLVSLVNAQRLQAGRSTLGWLNPSIYANAGGFTNDIVSGDNKCTANPDACCDVGFSAAVGWDPVTGFGSVDFQKFSKYYLDN